MKKKKKQGTPSPIQRNADRRFEIGLLVFILLLVLGFLIINFKMYRVMQKEEQKTSVQTNRKEQF